MGGWTNRQKNGVAASKPTAKSDQPSALTAKPIRNGMFPSVRFSIGTLKHASIVQYLSERSSSRLRNAFNWRATSRTAHAQAQGDRKQPRNSPRAGDRKQARKGSKDSSDSNTGTPVVTNFFGFSRN